MARGKRIGIRETSTTSLPNAEIKRLARASGAVWRRRNVDASAIVWSVLFVFGRIGHERFSHVRHPSTQAH